MDERKRVFVVSVADGVGAAVALVLFPLLWWANLELAYLLVLALGPAFSVRMGIRKYHVTHDPMAGVSSFLFGLLVCLVLLVGIRYRSFLTGLGLMTESPPR